jgi:hypothetical protein
MEHSVHVSAGHVIGHVTPIRTVKVVDVDQDDDGSSGDEDSDDGDGIIASASCKVLGLIRQVRVYPIP